MLAAVLASVIVQVPLVPVRVVSMPSVSAPAVAALSVSAPLASAPVVAVKTLPVLTSFVSEPRCAIADARLEELSGLAVTAAGVWAMADGGRRVEVHRLDLATCAIIETRTAKIDPYDAEDLAVGPDGALWVADTGDNERRRDTVAVIVLPARGQARLHRLSYPDGPHDAEALLVDSAGTPVIVTKDVGQPAGIYRPDAPPVGPAPTPLVRVGQLTLPPSDSVDGPVGPIGSRVVTGAAMSADGRVVALRSYTDAWLYPVPDGDVAGALSIADPVRVPLPGEPQGEAIAFQPDGTLLSGSETRDGVPGEIRVVPAAAAAAGHGVPNTGDRSPALPDTGAPPQWLPAAVGAVVTVGVLLLLTVGLAVRRR